MAKGINRRGRSLAPVSQQLDENFPVNFRVVGTGNWMDTQFEPSSLREGEKITVSCEGDLSSVKEILSLMPVIGIDTETTGKDEKSGLNPRSQDSRIVMMQIGNEDTVFVVEPTLISAFRGLLESKSFLHLLQNCVFDFEFLLEKYGIHLVRMYDPMLAEQLLTSGLVGMKVGLEDTARRYKPFRLISKEIRKQFFFLGDLKFTRKMVYYAARDIPLMFPIMREQIGLLKKYKMERVAQDEFDVIPCTAMMELGGVRIDPRVLRLALTHWNSRQAELETEILGLYDANLGEQGKRKLFLIEGMREVFNVKSPSSKLSALRNMGFELEDTKRDTIETIDHPIAKLLAEYSAVMKITSTYGENLLTKIDPNTGLFYPDFRQLGSGEEEGRGGKESKDTIATGRFSSDFQQMPRKVVRFAEAKDPEELSRVRLVFADKISQLGRKEVAIVDSN